MPGIELPSWSANLFWAVELPQSVVPQSPTVSVAYIWLGWVISPNIAYAFCMMYARLLAPNATADIQRLLLSCHKIRTADQAVFLHIYNTINTKSLQRLNFIQQIGFTCLKSQSPPSPLRNAVLDVPKPGLYLQIVELSKKKQNPQTLDYIQLQIVVYFYFTSFYSFVKCWYFKFSGMNSLGAYLVLKQETQGT